MAKKIMIDPGHAPGNANHGPTGYYEYAGMWALSDHLKTALERCGFTVNLTRKENECPELDDRGKAAKGCDAFISEHSNASGSGTARGCQVYYSVRLAEDSRFGAELAEAAASAMGSTNRGALTKKSTNDPAYDYYTVIGYAVGTGCPHVFLCETGFHDNAQDEAVLKQDSILQKIAEAQAKIICEHLGVTYKAAAAVAAVTTSVTAASASVTLAIGAKVRIKPGVTTFADGTQMASFVRSTVLYVRKIGTGKVLVSTVKTGAVTGWVKTADLVKG